MNDDNAQASGAPSVEEFLAACLEEQGDDYEFGAEVEPGTAGDAWDCSELVQVKLNELGIPAPDGSQAQFRWCEEHGEEIPLEEGIATPGALLFRVADSGHVAVSLGDGNTIEARGSDYGVGVFSATEGRSFNRAARVPGLDYGDAETYEPAPSEAPEEERPAMAEGSSGDTVKRLQRTLVKRGIDPGKIDGVFGGKTERAVRKLQKQLGVTIDGIVGKQTRRALWGTAGKTARQASRLVLGRGGATGAVGRRVREVVGGGGGRSGGGGARRRPAGGRARR